MVTLPNIERGQTWTPGHMQACLARYVAAQPPAARRAFFETWVRRHGHASAAALNTQAKAAFMAARGRA